MPFSLCKCFNTLCSVTVPYTLPTHCMFSFFSQSVTQCSPDFHIGTFFTLLRMPPCFGLSTLPHGSFSLSILLQHKQLAALPHGYPPNLTCAPTSGNNLLSHVNTHCDRLYFQMLGHYISHLICS